MPKYANLHADENLSELYLLLYYDQGWVYNSPYRSLHYGFLDVASELRVVTKTEHGRFDRVFLFDALDTKLAQVYP